MSEIRQMEPDNVKKTAIRIVKKMAIRDVKKTAISYAGKVNPLLWIHADTGTKMWVGHLRCCMILAGMIADRAGMPYARVFRKL